MSEVFKPVPMFKETRQLLRQGRRRLRALAQKELEELQQPLSDSEMERFKELAGQIQDQLHLDKILESSVVSEKRAEFVNMLKPYLSFVPEVPACR